MSQKNTLIIDGKAFVLDYGSGTIYRDVTLIPEATPGYLPLKGKENYPFKVIKNELYFQMGEKFYKVVNKKEVLEITKEEYDEMKKYIIINKNLNDSKVVQSYKQHVMAIIISEIIQEKYNKKISISVSKKELISRFIARLNPKINLDIDNLTIQIISKLPKWINRDEKRKHIKEAYDEIVQEDEDYIRILLDNIYESSEDIFCAIYNSLLKEPKIEEEETRKEEYKNEKYKVKLTLPARGARPAPPVSTVLGHTAINISKFCRDFNNWSKNLEGNVELGVIVYDDLSYDILTKEEIMRREMEDLATLYLRKQKIFKTLYEQIKGSSEDYNLNPISTIRQKLLDLYFLYDDDKKGGILIPIEDLNCLIYKGKELHFDQNQIYYSDSEGIIKINGTENEFVSRSQVQLTGKDEVRFDSITEPSEELQFLNNVIAKINTVLKDKNVHR